MFPRRRRMSRKRHGHVNWKGVGKAAHTIGDVAGAIPVVGGIARLVSRGVEKGAGVAGVIQRNKRRRKGLRPHPPGRPPVPRPGHGRRRPPGLVAGRGRVRPPGMLNEEGTEEGTEEGSEEGAEEELAGEGTALATTGGGGGMSSGKKLAAAAVALGIGAFVFSRRKG